MAPVMVALLLLLPHGVCAGTGNNGEEGIFVPGEEEADAMHPSDSVGVLPGDTAAAGHPPAVLTSVGDTLDTLSRRRALADTLWSRIAAVTATATVPVRMEAPSPRHVGPRELFVSDAVGVSEVLHLNPWHVTVPLSLSTRYNRALMRGYPLAWPSSSGRTDREHDARFRTDAGRIDISPLEGARFTSHPPRLATPMTNLFWETGLLGQSTVGVLFARPLTRSLDVGVHSTFRSFAGKRFDHTRGGIYQFYRDAAAEPDRVVRGGYHPLVNEHGAGVHLRLATPSGSPGVLAYRYGDYKNNYPYRDHARDTTVWDTTYRWVHHAALQTPVLRQGVFDHHLSVDLESSAQRTLQPADTRGLLADTIRGKEGGVHAVLTSGAQLRDGVRAGLVLEPVAGRRTLSDRSRWDRVSGSARLFLEGVRESGSLRLTGKGSGGHAVHRVNESRAHLWVGSLALRGGVVHRGEERVWVEAYGARSAWPYTPPFDTAYLRPGPVYDPVVQGGIDMWLGGERGGVLVGVAWRSEPDSTTLAHDWPYGAAPYRSPRLTALLAPSLILFDAVRLHGRYLFCDERPHHKVQGGVEGGFPLMSGVQFVRFGLLADYWSPRDPLPWEGDENWVRELLNLRLYSSVQIRSFRLFYKIDNLLNRRIAYLPGATMTGLTFRWGFSWLLQR